METTKLKKFAQAARRTLREQVTAKLALVLGAESAARRERTEAVQKLEEAIKNHGKEQVIERVAYIWFNRFCALRFMDVNRYTRIAVVSPAEGQSQPEILAEAKMGHIDEELADPKTRQHILDLLAGKTPSTDPQGEAYRMLLVASCNDWNRAMPFLFQRIDDYTELLMPDGLLSANSILEATREAMTPDACEEVEVIGWLYQFYISEKKDEVFDGLKKNNKITPENIPAATQLFTPHWIVRYLVENSLGRLWLLNRPGSKLGVQMDYYIKPEQEETDFLRIAKPEEIKICDPACGSGHMLTYAFDLLYAIYEEEGYEPAEIPEKILTLNLYGIEIDERAGELAAFALTMKARARQRRFFNKGVRPNICVLENVQFDEGELKDYMDFVGRDLFTAPLQTALCQFEEADNFGSLIRPDVTDVDGMLRILESKDVSGQLFLAMTHKKVLHALRQADYLSSKYHVVIANPPYMGGKGMNECLGSWAKANYPKSKSDLMTMFMEKARELCRDLGYWCMINLPSWMFLSSFEKLRTDLVDSQTICSLLHLGRGVFGSDFGSVAFVYKNHMNRDAVGSYRRLFEKHVQVRRVDDIKKLFLRSEYNKYVFLQSDFNKIPGSPIAYWASESVIRAFEEFETLKEFAVPSQGMATTNNDLFLRQWHECSKHNFVFPQELSDASRKSGKWFACNKGGPYRKWYGNNSMLVNYGNDGKSICDYIDSTPNVRVKSNGRVINRDKYFQVGTTWSTVTSSSFSMRYTPPGFAFETKGAMCFPGSEDSAKFLTALGCSKVVDYLLTFISPTVDYHEGPLGRLPIAPVQVGSVAPLAEIGIRLTQLDWDGNENSWDFASLPLLDPDYVLSTLEERYQKLRAGWWENTLEMQRLEEETNCIFIDAYGLQDELTPEMPLNEITLTCNPYYRYGKDKSEEELEALLLADTMRELVSYAVGCMFGRYALEKPGLILANQGETIGDYLEQIPEPSFPADDDNVIPMLDGDWFTDDIAERFRKFLRVAFGEKHYEENLRFVEQALNIKGKRNYSIRDYFLGEFYTDHVKRYKKRPIYWLFSSGSGRSGGSFNALIYMHRYRPDTVSVVLNDYLREFRGKLSTHLDHLRGVEASADATKSEKTRALKEIEKLKKTIDELDVWERDVMYPLATEQVAIDLDDGVKVNYPKFGAALKKITGLSA